MKQAYDLHAVQSAILQKGKTMSINHIAIITINCTTLSVSQSLKKTEHNLTHRYSQAVINLLKPTGHVMHQQFNIQQLYALSTLYLCVLYLSENKQRLVPLTA